jgi:hypothetical protein
MFAMHRGWCCRLQEASTQDPAPIELEVFSSRDAPLETSALQGPPRNNGHLKNKNKTWKTTITTTTTTPTTTQQHNTQTKHTNTTR